MKKLPILAFLALFCGAYANAVSLNFSGNFRTEGDLYSKLNLGQGNMENSKAFLHARALLQPKLVIDDHFSLNTQWNLLTSPNVTPQGTPQGTSTAGALGGGESGYIFGDPNTASMRLSRAWLEWVSDFGVVRIGRMPVSWGYGLVYDAGTGMWDDFQSTFDRLEYRLHFGHVVGALAYSKARKLSVIGNTSDQEFYTIFIKYDNPEQDVEAGIMYERQVRSASTSEELITTANPYHITAGGSGGGTRPPLAIRAPAPMSNNLLDLYAKKTIDYFTFGGEVAWLNGAAADFNQNGVEDNLNAFGFMLNVSYEYHKIKAFVDFMYAAGDSNLADDSLNGFTVVHRNRRPGLILGRELLGDYYNNSVGQGSLFYYGAPGSFSGAYYIRPGFRVEWSQAWGTGLEVIIANKASVAGGESSGLGVEVDAGVDHAVYKNFDVGLNLGYLFPGEGLLNRGGASGVFAFRTTASVKF